MDDGAETLFHEVADLPGHAVLAPRPANRTASLRLAQITRDRLLLSTLEGRQDQKRSLARKSAEWLERFQGDAH